jgi:PD-(D/E)XK nuclease superfamily
MQATQTVPASRVSQQTPSGSTILYGSAIRLDFDPKNHTYTVTDLLTQTVREVPSVTQILGVIGGSKVWGLKQWAANLASDYIRDAIRPGMRYDELQIEQIIERARKNFHTVSRGAKTIGQLAHEWIEAHLRARLYATPELPPPVNEQARKAIQAASAWIAEHFKPVSMEHRLYSREHDYAGTLDVVGEVDGQLAVVDWKTSKAIYDEMPLQAAAYAQAWSEMNDERVPDRWVIRLDKETGEFEPVKFPRETFRRDLRGFLAAKALHLTLDAMTTPKSPRPAKTASPPAVLLPQTQRKPTNSRAAAPALRRQSLDHKPRQRSVSYLKAGAVLILGGATYDLKDQLPTIGGQRSNEGGNWVWQIPFGALDALSALCKSRQIHLSRSAPLGASKPPEHRRHGRIQSASDDLKH